MAASAENAPSHYKVAPLISITLFLSFLSFNRALTDRSARTNRARTPCATLTCWSLRLFSLSFPLSLPLFLSVYNFSSSSLILSQLDNMFNQRRRLTTIAVRSLLRLLIYDYIHSADFWYTFMPCSHLAGGASIVVSRFSTIREIRARIYHSWIHK